MTIFLFLILIYIILCVSGVKVYFHLQNRNKTKVQSTFKEHSFSYLLFVLFIFLEIPFAIFFPAWLSEKLAVVERTSESTMYFLLLGCLVLAFSIWKGRKFRPKYF